MAGKIGTTGAPRNALLSKLPSDLRQSLRLQAVELPVNLVLYEPNKPMEYAYFPETGVLSVVALLTNGSSIEVGTVGREGMIGSVLLLHSDTTPYKHFVQVAGDGYRVAADRLNAMAESNAELRSAVLRYEASFRTQTMQGMACNGMHTVEQRCCRWLLMTRDRVDSDDLKLTHEFLGLMLGVRRPSVTEVLRPLQDAGLVRSNHGTIRILDRKGLEAKVCECYWIMVARET
jgi:CRP-like cAMP-binding protein